MSDTGDALSPIIFTYEYEGHGWARASISNGDETYDMEPSYVGGYPLFGLLQAVVALLRDGGGIAGCEWMYEPGLDRWALQREGDTLRITIRGRRDGDPSSSALTPSWFWISEAAGAVRFSTTCDLWTFAEQVRRAARRIAPTGEDDDSWKPWLLRKRAEYRALCEILDKHQGIQRPSSGKRPR